jgi:N-acetylmuramoyl-L-alanine amidase
MKRHHAISSITMLLLAGSLTSPAVAQRVYLNPSDQTANAVSGGGSEDEFALINANLARPILENAGFTVQVDQDFTNAPANANSWGADVFVSIHTNAGGGHGTETLYVSSGGQVLAGHVQDGLLSKLPYGSRGLKYRDNLHVLNATNMIACLTEALFHDCTATSGFQGHPPSESDYLRSAEGQQSIAEGIAAGVCAHFGTSCGTAPVPQTGTFKGVVYRAPNLDDYLADAVVQIEGGASVTTGADGAFAFELDPGSYIATATLDGFQPGSVTRDVIAGEEVWGSIGLEADEIEDAGADADPADALPFDAAETDVAVDAAPSTRPSSYTGEEASGCACGLGRPTSAHGAWGIAMAAGLLGWLLRRR